MLPPLAKILHCACYRLWLTPQRHHKCTWITIQNHQVAYIKILNYNIPVFLLAGWDTVIKKNGLQNGITPSVPSELERKL